VRYYDPSASLGQELQLRLTGELAQDGALAFSVGDALLKPLQDSAASLAEFDLELEITGLSRGSTVLHVRPKLPAAEQVAPDVPMDSSAADQAMRELLGLVAAAEHEEDLRRWARVLDSMDRFVRALEKYDLGVSMTWLALDGEARMAELTERGRAYYLGLRETSPVSRQRAVSGRVTELRESGVVKVKTGTARSAPAYEVRVDLAELMGMHLELGQSVSFLVSEEQEKDRTGQVHATTWTFVRHLTSADRLEFDAEE
jgi:hypothetical protein